MVIDLEYARKQQFEFSQEMEAIESKMAQVRLFQSLSPRQQQAYVEAQQVSPKVVFGRIAGEASRAYRKACKLWP